MLQSTDLQVIASLLQGTADVGLISYGIMETVLQNKIFPGLTAGQLKVSNH